MGTRAVITFIDEHDEYETYHVFQHWDGDPSTVLAHVENAKAYAWPLPRFEPDDFAAAFIAANKDKRGGNIRLSHTYEDYGDLSYRYEVRATDGGDLEVRIFEPVYDSGSEITEWATSKYVPMTEAG